VDWPGDWLAGIGWRDWPEGATVGGKKNAAPGAPRRRLPLGERCWFEYVSVAVAPQKLTLQPVPKCTVML
jgi:hypothetical protein